MIASFPSFTHHRLSCVPMTCQTLERITARDARRLLLSAQGLLHDPARPATTATLNRLIRQMGFVQLDTISAVDRAHHLTLFSRLDDFQPNQLDHLLENKRQLFEHWTHDASMIDIAWYPHWKHRFELYRQTTARNTWWQQRIGRNPQPVIDHVIERITNEGPLRSIDFEHDRQGESGAWWGWKPQKCALEFLWRAGVLAVTRREKFQKVYDLSCRVHPEWHDQPAPPRAETVDALCIAAMERLIIATHSEVMHYWRGVTPAEARSWCTVAEREGRLVRINVEDANRDNTRPAYALADWRKRLATLPAAPNRMRLLSPFDPVIRDRDRALRRFGFDYRFEAFVPAPKRKFGYYIMPVLDGDELIARTDPKTHRDQDVLEVRRIWWEPGITPTKARRARLEEAIAHLAAQIGVGHYQISAA